MEIRNRDDAQFILRHRAVKEMSRQWKKKGRVLCGLIIPLAIYAFCVIGAYPHAGEVGQPDIPEGVMYGFVILFFWLIIPAGVAMICFEKDKESLVKKYMDEATKAGVIDKEQGK
jgi:hypothetical protein